MDTDSVYLDAQPILAEHLYPDFEYLPLKEREMIIIEKVALKYQDIITNYYDDLCKELF